MNKNGHTPQGLDAVDYAAAAIEQMDTYCTANPKSPSAMRRPKLFVRSDLWIALFGPSIEEGIVGIGPDVAAALRAFDAQYNAGLPNETISSSIKPEQSFAADARLLPNYWHSRSRDMRSSA
jgi:hypothetical protein